MKSSGGVRFALEMEKKGLIHYLDSAGCSPEPLTKRLFYSLAAQELEHAVKVDSLASSAEFSGSPVSSPVGIEKEMKAFFRRFSSSSAISATQEKAYEKAMELERKSYAAYSQLASAALTPAEKKFFTALMNEENGHLTALLNVYNYLTKNGDWSGEDESRVWNWMNQ